MMRLYYSKNSPYSRKCRIALYLSGLTDKTEQIAVDPFNNTDYRQTNPFGKVPAFITDSVALFDSPIICEYLDQQAQKLSKTKALFPNPNDKNYFLIQASHAQANGIIDAAVATVMETRRSTEHSQYWLDRWQQSIESAVKTSSTQYIGNTNEVNIATIAMATALGYLDFRLGHFEWRRWNLELAQWFDGVSDSDWMQITKPAL